MLGGLRPPPKWATQEYPMTKSSKTHATESGTHTLAKPDSSAPDWIIDNIAEASKGAQQVFFILISLLSYCAITITATADRQIILNSTVQLPLLSSAVSLDGFFIIAPLVSLLVFAYLQLYLQRLKGLIHQLRQYGDIEPRRLYPWALTIAEDPEPGSIGVLQRAITGFCLWWLLPLVLLLFAFWSVKKHSIGLSYTVSFWPIIGLLEVLYFWSKYEMRPHTIRFSRSMWALVVVIITASAFHLAYLIPAATYAGRSAYRSDRAESGLVGHWHSLVRSWTCVDLSYQVLVSEQKKEYDTLWVDLENAHFEGANLDHTILKLANLKNANLQGANLRSTTLRAALLDGTDFRDSNMLGVDLSYAKLHGVKNVDLQELCTAKTLYKAEMDAELQSKVNSACPYLLSEKSQD
jgi:Pentapeptide repeats (8 copies)